MDFGSKIAYYRKERNMTQEELASQFDISNQAVSKWETGQSYPDVELLPKIADFFEISLDELFGREFSIKKSAEAVNEKGQDDERKEAIGQATLPAPVTLPDTIGWPVPEQRDTFDDRDALYVVLYQGSRLVHEEEIKKHFGHIANKLSFSYDGPALNVYSIFSVVCDNVQGNVTAGGYVECGDVGDSVAAGSYVECGDVGCNVQSAAYVECGDVGGNVSAEGNVECGDVGGSVTAGSITR